MKIKVRCVKYVVPGTKQVLHQCQLFYYSIPGTLSDFKGQVGFKLVEAASLGRSKVLNITREFMV